MGRPWAAVVMVFLFLGSACLLSGAQTPDPHFASPCTTYAVRQSTFLHGYLHGYEEGYSIADLDLQMGRSARDPGKLKEARSALGYRPEFGSRNAFDAGYGQGFRVGYADSFAGRSFRAVALMQQVMELAVEAVPGTPAPAAPRPWVPHASALLEEEPPPAKQKIVDSSASPFDQGFADGYRTGQRRGLSDARSALPFAGALSACPPELFSQTSGGPQTCTGYIRGFAMGYSDGYVNVARPGVVAASVGGSGN